MENRLNEIEIRYMRQERTIQELSDVVFRQGVEIGRLRRDIERLREQLGSMNAGGIPDPGEEPPPPHY